jgi:hypothetical protein
LICLSLSIAFSFFVVSFFSPVFVHSRSFGRSLLPQNLIILPNTFETSVVQAFCWLYCLYANRINGGLCSKELGLMRHSGGMSGTSMEHVHQPHHPDCGERVITLTLRCKFTTRQTSNSG